MRPLFSREMEVVGYIDWGTQQYKPNPPDKYYYMTQMDIKKYKKMRAKYKLTRSGKFQNHTFYTKNEIDRIPKAYRRGGEYGHDMVKLSVGKRSFRNMKTNVSLCKRLGLEYTLIQIITL